MEGNDRWNSQIHKNPDISTFQPLKEATPTLKCCLIGQDERGSLLLVLWCVCDLRFVSLCFFDRDNCCWCEFANAFICVSVLGEHTFSQFVLAVLCV